MPAELSDLMRSHGYVLVRRNKHCIWRGPQGEMVVTSLTPSDWRALKKIEALLRRLARSKEIVN